MSTFGRKKIYPAIQADYAALLQMPPSRLALAAARKRERAERKQAKKEKKESENDQGDDDGGDESSVAKIQEVVAVVREKTEKRNVYLNLAWTGPVANTPLQANISLR